MGLGSRGCIPNRSPKASGNNLNFIQSRKCSANCQSFDLSLFVFIDVFLVVGQHQRIQLQVPIQARRRWSRFLDFNQEHENIYFKEIQNFSFKNHHFRCRNRCF